MQDGRVGMAASHNRGSPEVEALQSGQIRYSALKGKVIGRILKLSQLGERVETTIEDKVVRCARNRQLGLRLLVDFGADRDEDAVAFAFDLGFRTPLATRLSFIALKVVISQTICQRGAVPTLTFLLLQLMQPVLRCAANWSTFLKIS